MSNFVRKVFCGGRYDEKIGDGLSFKLPLHESKSIRQYMKMMYIDILYPL